MILIEALHLPGRACWNSKIQVFRACLARFKLVPVQEDGRRRKNMQIKREREKEKRQEEEKGGSRQ